jgi:hypothetical protein
MDGKNLGKGSAIHPRSSFSHLCFQTRCDKTGYRAYRTASQCGDTPVAGSQQRDRFQCEPPMRKKKRTWLDGIRHRSRSFADPNASLCDREIDGNNDQQ